MDYQLFTLPNGIRVVHKAGHDTGIAHCCIVVDAGSRDEDITKPGLAHFLEHLLFKGTTNRKTHHVLNRIEAVGGDLNAYTTKEHTCIHASVLSQHIDRALDLLCDVVFRSTFPEKEIEKEKGVVTDEIDSYRDSPEDFINDEFDALVFPNHPLGANILGSRESVATFNKADLQQYIQQQYATDRIVVGIFGSFTPKQLQRILEKHLASIPANYAQRTRSLPVDSQPMQSTERKPIQQAHCVLGSRAYSIHDERKTATLLLANLLGGPGMSSRLNLNIREKHGYCYSIEAGYHGYTDTGIFSIYFGTDPAKVKKCTDLVWKELKVLREVPLTASQLHLAKERFKGQIALAEESRLSILISICKSVIDYGYADSLEVIFQKIDAVSAGEMQIIAQDILHPDKMSQLLFLPEEE